MRGRREDILERARTSVHGGRDVILDGELLDHIVPLNNGAALHQPAVSITYTAGPVANCHVERSGGGDFEVLIGGVIYPFVADTVALTQGTDTAPVANHVWIELIADVATLVSGTSGFPTSYAFVPCANILLQTAASAQTFGVYKVHAWTDHVSNGNGMGHMAHLNYWIRLQQATWWFGAVPTVTIVGASSPDDVFFSSTSGTILQLHDHAYPAMDMDGVDEAYVVNDPTTPYTRVTNLNGLLTDASGGSLSGRAFSLVIWGVVSEDEGDCQLMVNLPLDSYSQGGSAVLDALGHSVYSIPTEFIGTGFLIARVTLSHSPAGGGTFTLEDTSDLRGLLPNTSAGASSATIDTHIGNIDHTLEGNRIVDDGNLGYLLFFDLEDGGGQKAQILMNPNVPSISVQSNDGAGNVAAVEVGSDGVNLAFTGTSDLSVDGAPGAAGEVLESAGSGSAPAWVSRSIAKALGNTSSASIDDTEVAVVWAAVAFNSGSDVSVSGSVWTIANAGTYEFTVTVHATTAELTQLEIRTFLNAAHVTAELVSNSIVRAGDTDVVGGFTKTYVAELSATDTVQFRAFGSTDGACTLLDAGTICVVKRVA